MTTHTPGPWTAHDDDGTGTMPCVLSGSVNRGGNFYVAQCNNYADARLIAAAPDLLGALQAIMIFVLTEEHPDFNVLEIARLAIAQAENP